MRLFSSAIVLLSSLSLAAAQLDLIYFSDNSYPLTTGNLVSRCIFAFVYLVQIILCLTALVLVRNNRIPYAFLLPAVIFSFLGYLLAIITDMLISTFESITARHALGTPTSALMTLFKDLACILLFVAVVTLIFNRHNALHKASEGRVRNVHVMAYLTLGMFAALLLIMGLTAVGLRVALYNAYYNAKEHHISTYRNPVILRTAMNFYNVYLAFNAFLILSVAFVVAHAIVLYIAARRSKISNTITNVAVFAITPLYVASTIITIAFTAEYSTDYWKTNISPDTFDIVALVWTVFGNLFYCATAMTIIIMGLIRRNWEIGAQPPQPQSMMQGIPQLYYPSQQQQQQYVWQNAYAPPLPSPQHEHEGPQSIGQ